MSSPTDINKLSFVLNACKAFACICSEGFHLYKVAIAFVTTFAEAIAYYEENDPKGECVLVIEGKSRAQIIAEEQNKWEQMTLSEHMEHYLNQGIAKKEAMKMVAKDRGMAKRDIYKALLEEE